MRCGERAVRAVARMSGAGPGRRLTMSGTACGAGRGSGPWTAAVRVARLRGIFGAGLPDWRWRFSRPG